VALYSETELREAVHSCWTVRENARQRQVAKSRVDEPGLRSGVTAGKHLDAVTAVITKVIATAGMAPSSIYFDSHVEVPGFYRPQKKWDIVVVHQDELVAVIELKSILKSYGNNLNNRSEEAIGNAVDLLAAYSEGLLPGNVRTPWIGYLFVMQSDDASTRPVRVSAPHFPADPAFVDASYLQRAELLLRRLMQQRLYGGTCLIVSDGSGPDAVIQPVSDLTFSKFAAGLTGRVTEALA
jgi:Restriction endonuclease XhoI